MVFEYCENYRDTSLTPLVPALVLCCVVPNLKCQIHFVPQIQRKPITAAPARLHQPAEAEFHPHHRHQVMADTGTRHQIQEIQGKIAHFYVYSTI